VFKCTMFTLASQDSDAELERFRTKERLDPKFGRSLQIGSEKFTWFRASVASFRVGSSEAPWRISVVPRDTQSR
jgi:hypothetical protein